MDILEIINESTYLIDKDGSLKLKFLFDLIDVDGVRSYQNKLYLIPLR